MSKITDIYRYPVKSMGGHPLATTPLTARGIPGDRSWTLKDETRGGIKGGKRFPELMAMAAELLHEPSDSQPSAPVRITLPDGRTVLHTDADVNAQLSDAVGNPVSLWPLLPADNVDHYLRQPAPPGTDVEASLRETFAREPDEPLPDLSVFPPELFTYESPPGTYFDAFPLLILSHQALATMSALGSDSEFDVRRFRPNIVVDCDSEAAFPEQGWVGHDLRIGEAVVHVEMVCPRCVMTTHGFHELPKDPQVMRHLVQANDGNLGVYATVTTPGLIRTSDTITVL